jgi:hypothetical protein
MAKVAILARALNLQTLKIAELETIMANIKSRVEKLEAEAAARVRPAGVWASYWQRVRKVYGDHGSYSDAELEQLDQIDPVATIRHFYNQANGSKRKA